MSYGIMRVQKIGGQGAVGGLQIHNRREKDGVSHTNKDIDWSKTSRNYTLKNTPASSYNELIKARLAEGYTGAKTVRKDAVKLCEALFTSDKDFFDGLSERKQRKFFEDCYRYACNKYGEENIISATVHLDERTPHMHVDFVPLTADGRLSAKDVIGGRKDLQELQDDFYNKVSRHWGLERGERGSTAKHLSVLAYKVKTAQENLNKAEQELADFLEVNQAELSDKQQLDLIGSQTKSKGVFRKVRQLPEENYQELLKTAQKASGLNKQLSEATARAEQAEIKLWSKERAVKAFVAQKAQELADARRETEMFERELNNRVDFEHSVGLTDEQYFRWEQEQKQKAQAQEKVIDLTRRSRGLGL